MSSRWQRSDAVLWRRSVASYVVLGQEDPIVLNATGAALWEELVRPRTVSELADALAERFDVEHARVEPDVKQVLDDLRQRGLVVTR